MNRSISFLMSVGFGLLSSGLGLASQLDQTQETCALYKQRDQALNGRLDHIAKDPAYAAKKDFISALKAEQKAWLRFRDAALEAKFPGKDKRAEWGSVYPQCSCGYLLQLTEQRIENLESWVQGIAEGDVCRGSIKQR